MSDIGEFFSERKTPYTLFVLAAAGHLVFFYALLYIYGPCSFFLSNDCKLNGNDTQHYVILAENLTHGHGYSRFLDPPYEPDALRTPLMSLYFAPFTYFGGYSLIWLAILLLNIILSLAAPFAYKLARLYLSHGYALAAGVVMAFEPLFLYRSQIAEPDAFLVLLLLASVFFVVRSWQRQSGPDIYRAALLLGFAILAKPSALYLTAMIFIFEAAFLSFFTAENTTVRLKRFGVAFLITTAVVFPWLLRNSLVFGVPAVSSIQGYNLYQYYTSSLVLPGEEVPTAMLSGSREPSRYLPYQKYFTEVAFARIKTHPLAYLKEQAVGTLRNLFVSDISQIYYYSHTRILPFPYDPESRTNIHELLLAGDWRGTIQAFLSVHVLPKVLWILFLGGIYALAFIGWFFARRERFAFLSFTMFFCLYGYLLVASGPFVDAKYRLPALLFIVLVALYATERISARYSLRVHPK